LRLTSARQRPLWCEHRRCLGRQNEQASRALEGVYRERSTLLGYLKMDPRFGPLRPDPRFQNLLSHIRPRYQYRPREFSSTRMQSSEKRANALCPVILTVDQWAFASSN
jgi:hypothetical protein